MIKKKSIIAIITAITMALPGTICFAQEKAINSNVDLNRISGENRYSTSAEISKIGWKNSDNLIIATGDEFADGLCSSILSKVLDAPLLLTSSKTLDKSVESEIERLKVKNVYIIGGEKVISKTIETALLNKNIKTERISGENRFETSVKIAEKAKSLAKEKGLSFSSDAFIAYGFDYPDAVSTAALSSNMLMPILLTDKNSTPKVVLDYIKNEAFKNAYVVGGNAVIADNVKTDLEFYSNVKSKRIAGENRYATNLALVKEFSNKIKFEKVYFATGTNFPDALAGSVLAAKNNSAILLMDNTFTNETQDFLKEKSKDIKGITVLGGNIVKEEIIKEVKKVVEEQKNKDNGGTVVIPPVNPPVNPPADNEVIYGTNPKVTVNKKEVKFNYNFKFDELGIVLIVYQKGTQNIVSTDAATINKLNSSEYEYKEKLDAGEYTVSIGITLRDGSVKKTNIDIVVK